MRVILAFIALLFFIAPANATVKISTLDPGGSVQTYLDYWTRVANSGENVVIDAPCISACSFFLGMVPEDKVCITARASIGVHQLSMDDEPNPILSASFYRWLYPQWVQQWIKDHGGLRADVMFMYPEDTKGHIALCEGQQYDTISPDELIHNTKE